MQSKPIHTHYDNLKVARDAPKEVIRAAYKTLSQKYHPDRNANPQASGIMKMVNSAYEVLSDPRRRQAHDDWISQEEGRSALGDQSIEAQSTESHTPPNPRIANVRWRSIVGRMHSSVARVARLPHTWIYIICGGVVAYGILFDSRSVAPQPGPKPYVTVAPVVSPLPHQRVEQPPPYVRPLTDPNGYAWPQSAELLSDYPQLDVSGHSEVTVDNSRGGSDVFVKLVSLNGPEAYPVRTAFVPAKASITLRGLTAGTYDIRYRDLDDGSLSRTESFDISEHEVRDEDGTAVEFTTLSFSLYKVSNGNAQSYPLAESGF